MLSRLSTGGKAPFVVASVTVLLFAAFSTIGIERQIQFGPGHYLDAFQYMADNSNDRDIIITSDSDGRYGETLLPFYAPLIKTNKAVFYVSNQVKNAAPEWLLVEDPDPNYTPYHATLLKDLILSFLRTT